jgi:hypothetical protein
MPKYTVVGVRTETPAEAALRAWFDAQVTAAPDNLEGAARLIIGLVTTLLGVLLGVLALASDKTPAFLRTPDIKDISVGGIVLLFMALASGLVVVIPFEGGANSARPVSQAAAFKNLLQRKSAALTVSAVAFGFGVLALSTVLVIAVMRAP